MHSRSIYQAVDFSVYTETVKGAYNPVSSSATNYKSPIQLVRLANSRVVCSAPTKEEASKSIENIDLTIFGYNHAKDIDVKYVVSSTSKLHQVLIQPKIIYPLLEYIKIPAPPDAKCKLYFDFFSDEFERMKIRSENIMKHVPSVKKVYAYACRNLQLARKLYHDSRFLFHSMRSNPAGRVSESDIYIIYILNLFIIRAIVYYTKFFQPYLKETPESEQALRDSFNQEIPRALKYPFLYQQEQEPYKTRYNFGEKKIVHDVVSPYTNKLNEEIAKIPVQDLWDLVNLYNIRGCLQITENTNVLAGEVFRMTNEPRESGSPLVICDNPKVSKVFSYFSTDQYGNPVNENTFNSYLKPSNTIKRPGISPFSKDPKKEKGEDE
ncbi:MAG TPA: hypothetical protein DEH02_11605 [Bacteroidales bacterium]|nr:MAG: hypothetical protein A2X01_18140 [Bacteroidetes bacterium GWF2_35_48]HBX51700.1 hypothetical protein [Bacteroidales bacterium]